MTHNFNNMNSTNINVPMNNTELKENKQLSIIELAKEAVKNFPEKKNATHKEIIDLVEDWENYDQGETENKAHNKKLLEKYNEIEPIIKEIEQAQTILSNADHKLNKIIDELFKDKIAQAGERTKTGDGGSKEYLEKHPIPDKNSTFYRKVNEVERLKNGNIDKKTQTLRTLLKDGYYGNRSTETGRQSEYYGEDKRDAEKKLKTRLAKIGAIEK